VLDADERAFLTTPSPKALSDSELGDVAGGGCDDDWTCMGYCKPNCCGD